MVSYYGRFSLDDYHFKIMVMIYRYYGLYIMERGHLLFKTAQLP